MPSSPRRRPRPHRRARGPGPGFRRGLERCGRQFGPQERGEQKHDAALRAAVHCRRPAISRRPPANAPPGTRQHATASARRGRSAAASSRVLRAALPGTAPSAHRRRVDGSPAPARAAATERSWRWPNLRIAAAPLTRPPGGAASGPVARGRANPPAAGVGRTAPSPANGSTATRLGPVPQWPHARTALRTRGSVPEPRTSGRGVPQRRQAIARVPPSRIGATATKVDRHRQFSAFTPPCQCTERSSDRRATRRLRPAPMPLRKPPWRLRCAQGPTASR